VFMMGLDGMLGWALSASPGGILVGAPATLITMVFFVGFLMPLKILVAILQAFIFCMLTMLYIAMALEEPEHAEHH
jgi:F0F1-type ATP synthase membrane subunit a